MTSIIKNQLVKHLSKFAKNLTPDQISLDVLKGKSELKNIVLNEEVLTEVLELPVWLRIKRATCNRVMVKIPWTKLKSAPIELLIDEIQVEAILTADKPPTKKHNVLAAYAMDSGSYGFANKVVEGMSIFVTTLELRFDSGEFGGSFMLSRLSVVSRTASFLNATDLRQTRLTCPASNRTILYKQVSWQLLRIEASAHAEGAQRSTINAPLRLITSNGRIKIELKKNYTDGSVLHARITMILEDILWVATLPQLQSAIAFYSHIMKLINDAQGFAPHESSVVAARTPQSLAPTDTAAAAPVAMSSTFRNFDFHQTSYHLHVTKIDLHLCDDAHSASVYPPGWDIDSGAIQVTVVLLLIDIYPKTVAASDRSTWVRYASPNAVTHFQERNLKSHFDKLSEGLDETGRLRLKRCWPQLMSFNVVFRMHDMNVQCVSDVSTKKDALCNLFYTHREQRRVPKDQFVLHVEFANFAHPMTDSLPVPPSFTHAQLGPFTLLFDKRTIRWCLYVLHNLTRTFNESDAPAMEPMPQTDICIELLMAKLIIRLPDPSSDIRMPHRLLASLSSLSLTNRPLQGCANYLCLDKHLLDYIDTVDLAKCGDILRSDLIQMKSPATVTGIDEGDQFWLRTSPVWVETDYGENTKPLNLLSDVSFMGSFTVRKEQVNVFVEPQCALSALVDHFQVIQLLRLVNDLSLFTDLLSSDQKHLDKGKLSAAPSVLIVAPIAKINLHLVLTLGPLASPYEACPAINENQIENGFSDSDSGAGRGETPLPARAASASALSATTSQIPDPVTEFYEFPSGGIDADYDELASNLDETMSITTEVSDDDAKFITVEAPADEQPELAEEAVVIEERGENDRIHKSIMAKNVNVLDAEVEDTAIVISMQNQNFDLHGQAKTLKLSEQMNRLRSDVYAALQASTNFSDPVHSDLPAKILFKLSAPNEQKYATLTALARNLDLSLSDEIVAHLSPFVQDEVAAENHLRLQLSLVNSTVQITDPRKKKPLRLRIKDIVIEQDED